jgi:hypothetical protein
MFVVGGWFDLWGADFLVAFKSCSSVSVLDGLWGVVAVVPVTGVPVDAVADQLLSGRPGLPAPHCPPSPLEGPARSSCLLRRRGWAGAALRGLAARRVGVFGRERRGGGGRGRCARVGCMAPGPADHRGARGLLRCPLPCQPTSPTPGAPRHAVARLHHCGAAALRLQRRRGRR